MLNERMLAGCDAVLEQYSLPGYTVGIGSKGCVTFSPQKIVDYESFKANQDGELTELAWLYNMNRGIFMTPGPRGGVDAVGDAHRRGHRRLRAGLRRDGRGDHAVAPSRATGAHRARTPHHEHTQSPHEAGTDSRSCRLSADVPLCVFELL